ncbi:MULTISPECIES: hypothetical protein [Clostridium]|uniref:hypothetical protein n=1 Tax=Clostridium TaxID=1485 RepID=UPI001EF18E56|nr:MULTISPECIES: hypothetical protein [Clostridium]
MIDKNDIIPGQVSIFDLEFVKPQEPREKLKPVSIIKSKGNDNKFAEIINLYSSVAVRIVKQVCGALLVELEDKTLYFNPGGIQELELKKDMELMPADEILVVNKDKEINSMQLKKLEDMHVNQYIKRKGDANIIITFSGKTIVINQRGWVLEYQQKPRYHDNELFITEMANKSTDFANNVTEIYRNITKSVNEDTEFKNDENELGNLQIGDKVEFNYDGHQIGNITSIYNNGETVNVVWNHKHTAFYYKCVKKIS